ncbi:MAG TPA: thermonuclease family protein, partial [Pseudomonadales bacterium]
MLPSTPTTADPTGRALIALLLVVLGACTAEATEMQGTVTRVWDGDTVTLTVHGQEHRVRLGAIDAPEHDQPYGRQARAHLSRLVLNETVRLVTETTDPYGRLVGTLWVQP